MVFTNSATARSEHVLIHVCDKEDLNVGDGIHKALLRCPTVGSKVRRKENSNIIMNAQSDCNTRGMNPENCKISKPDLESYAFYLSATSIHGKLCTETVVEHRVQSTRIFDNRALRKSKLRELLTIRTQLYAETFNIYDECLLMFKLLGRTLCFDHSQNTINFPATIFLVFGHPSSAAKM